MVKIVPLLCSNNKSAYIQSEEAFENQFGAITIKIEHCIEYESPENCASEEEAIRFWSTYNKPIFATI